MTIELRVQPRAKRNALVPTADGHWKLYLTSPAVEGQANAAMIEFLAKGLGISRSRVRLIAGEKARQKVVALDGITQEHLRGIASVK